MKKFLFYVTFCSLLAAAPVAAQTFEINGQPPQNAPQKQNKSGQKTAPGPSDSIGWGSSIEVGRLSRAAEDAMKHGNPAAAADYVARALKAAPNNNRLWFLLGYTSRLAGRYQPSVDAYQHGLQNEPNSVEGLSGLAQTYMRMGRADEAKKLLLQVIAANPRRPIDLMMAGELFLQSGDLQQGVSLVQRSESLQPSAHAEVLLATAYMKMKQPERAKQLLDRAKARGGKNADVFRAVANYYREMRDYKSALATLLQVPNKTPDLMAEIGYTYALNGDKKQSADAYVKAANGLPRDLKTQVSAAEALVRLGDMENARKYLGRAEAVDPNYYRLHAVRADMARTERRTQDAIKEFNVALANMPAGGALEGVLYPIQLRMSLAEQYRDAGEPDNYKQQVALAHRQIAQINVEGPAQPEYLRLRASIKTAEEDYAGAEADLKQAMALDPKNLNTIIQYAATLWKMKRPDDARKMYQQALALDPNNRFALESMGYLAREVGDNKTAEEFFKKLQAAYPTDYVPYLALGDLYTALKEFPKADQSYQAAYKIAPSNSLIVASGANAAIEAHQIPLAGAWLERAVGVMKDDPRVMKERERYLFHTGKYLESAQLGYKVIEKMPHDRDGAVYLAYDLYNLGRYDDSLAVARRFEQVLPKEPNFPLLAGHSEKQVQLLAEAVDDYTRAAELDPHMVEAYINRGYVLNDMQNAEQAAQDFNYVLKQVPNNGVAHLGLAFSYLELHKGKLALEQADTAQKLLGESGSTHLARAGALRQMRLLSEAEREYRAALKYAPSDLTLHLALADTLYHLRRYPDSITALNDALALSPDDASIYGKMAHAYAQLHRREDTLKYVEAAEKQAPDSSSVLLDTGDALFTLGDRQAAMSRFEKALEAPDANRVDARLLIAKLMAHEGHWDDARQQVSLAFAEARIGEASPVTTENLIEAANLFLAMHEFDLAQQYFNKAQQAGAADQVIAIGMANTYLAQGDSQNAQAQLASLGNPSDFSSDYDYTIAMANVYRERRDTLHALTAFARASQLGGDEDDIADRGMQATAAEEGYRINQKFSVATDLNVAPIFDDATIYTTYARLNGGNISALPPHSLLETRWINSYKIHQDGWPLINGFFEMRNARGSYAVPSLFQVLHVNTLDYVFNGGISPVAHLGRNTITFNTGVAFTARRDSLSPIQLNQNLFRQFLYMQTNSFWNWISVRGSAMREAGPFTRQNLNSRDLVANLEFQVGRPWGRTAMLTGYRVRDLLFHPRDMEWYQTSAYVGLQHRFGEKLTAAGLGEYIRGWAVDNGKFGNGQIMRPAFELNYKPNLRWEANARFAYSRGQGLHDYDNMQSGFFISYVKPLRRNLSDGVGSVPVEYPLRFSIGLEQQDFFKFAGGGQAQFRPVVRLTLF